MKFNHEAHPVANCIDIVKATQDKKEDYKGVFTNCALYNHYFKKGDLLDKCLDEAISRGEGYAAVDREGNVVGFMSMKASDPNVDGLPNLVLIGVKDSCRGKGIGEMLVDFYTGVMAGLGFEEAAIVVNDWNPRARKLYDTLGYKLKKSMSDPFVGEYTDYVLTKKL